jgi:phytoene synthase
MADDAAFGSFAEKWIRENPEQAVVAIFLPPPRRRIACAFGCLVNELEETTFEIREQQVAALKLNWWRDELARASAGHARHPVTHELFAAADAAARGLRWPGLVDGALEVLDQATASSTIDAFAILGNFYGNVARLEGALLDAKWAPEDAAADLWSGARLLRQAARVERQPERSPLPLDLLARHGLTRASLAHPGDARSGALRDFLEGWSRKMQAALDARVGSAGRRVRARLDIGLSRRAIDAPDPAVVLASALPRRWSSVWIAWSEARRARREQFKASGA